MTKIIQKELKLVIKKELSNLEKLKIAKENQKMCDILNYSTDEEVFRNIKILDINEEKGIVEVNSKEYGDLKWEIKAINNIVIK